MYPVSAEFREALEAGNPQRIFIVFQNGTIMTNEHIAVDAGVTLHETWCDEEDITIGNTGSAEINFVLFNDEGEWSNFTFGRFKAYIGVELFTSDSDIDVLTVSVNDETRMATVQVNEIESTYELMPLGVFVGTRPNVVSTSEITVSSNDLMTLFDVDMPSMTDLGYSDSSFPITAGSLLRAMCTHVGVSATAYSFLNSGATLAEWPDSFESCTMRDVLSWIAEVACANAMFNRDGKLELRWLQTVNRTYDENQYLEHTPYWYNVNSVDSVHVRETASDNEDIVGTGTNAYLIQDNPFVGVNGS